MNLFPASKTIETGLKPERKQSFKKNVLHYLLLKVSRKRKFSGIALIILKLANVINLILLNGYYPFNINITFVLLYSIIKYHGYAKLHHQ